MMMILVLLIKFIYMLSIQKTSFQAYLKYIINRHDKNHFENLKNPNAFIEFSNKKQNI